MDTPHTLTGSKDGPGAGDHDQGYVYGNPKACLTTMQLLRLTILRGYILDASHAPPGTRYGGDQGYTMPSRSGLLLVDDSRP